MVKFLLIASLVCGFLAGSQAKFLLNLDNFKQDPISYTGSKLDFRVYSDRENVVEDVYFRYYNGKTTRDFVDIKLPEVTRLLKTNGFNLDQQTVFYIHGYIENPTKESVDVVVSSYLEAQPNTNIVLIDWSNMAFGSYFLNAAPNTRKVGHGLSEAIKKLIDGGLNLSKLHIVGHSLGAQIAGFAANDVQRFNFKLKRITGLDPAFPLFYPGFVLGHMSEKDAEFVDIIHTDPGYYGVPVSTGSIDFWPNGRTGPQPGCRHTLVPLSDDDLCSHWRSWRYWAESIRNPSAFPAVPFTSHFKSTHELRADNIAYMGIQADERFTGDYYLTTNAQSLFGKGKIEMRN